VLEHVNFPIQTLSAAVTLLKPSGILCLDTPIRDGGRDYGWNILEAEDCSSVYVGNCDVDSLVTAMDLLLPIHTYPHDGSSAAVIGGYVYRGQRIPELFGTYLFADFPRVGTVWALTPDGENPVLDARSIANDLNLPPGYNVSSFGHDGFGELYLVGYFSGRVRKIELK
jgi:hypothetical protein